MINSESLPQEHLSTPRKKETRYKKSKRGMSYRKSGTGDQATHKHNNNYDRVSDTSRAAGADMVDIASGLIGTCVQVTVKNCARFQGTLSEASSPANDHLEILLKNVCDIKKNELDLATRMESLTIKGGDLLDIVHVKGTNGKNVFKAYEENSGNMTRQQHHLQRWRPTTASEVLDEESLASLELNRSGDGTSSSSDTTFAANEKLAGLKADFDEDLYTTNIEQKSNEIHQSSRNNTHVLQRLDRTSEYQTWDGKDGHGAMNKYPTNDNGISSHRPWKLSAKTSETKKSQRTYRSQSRPFYQINNYDQKEKQLTNHCTPQYSKESAMLNKETMTARDTKPTTTNLPHSSNYSKTGTVPHANRKNTHLFAENSKNTNRNNYQNKKWIRNDMNANNNITTRHHRRYNYKNDNAVNINNIKPATNNENLLAPPSTPFKLNIMATEFIPFGGAHSLPNEVKPKDIPSSSSTVSSVSSSSTPQTPPSRKQEFVSVNEIFPAPFNKSGYSAPNNTDPLWQYGQSSYRNLYNFTGLPGADWLMAQYQNLHQFHYGYHQINMPPYPIPSYVPHYHQQQYKHSLRNNPNMMYPAPSFNRNMKGAGNQQSYPGVLTYQNYY